MNTYKIAAEAKQQIKHYTKVYNDLKPQLSSYVNKSKDRKVVNEYGTWQIVLQPKYRYSAKVDDLAVQLEELKAPERKNGIAQIDAASEQLRYNA